MHLADIREKSFSGDRRIDDQLVQWGLISTRAVEMESPYEKEDDGTILNVQGIYMGNS